MDTSSSDNARWRTPDYLKLAACFIPAAVFTWGIHEFAHWLMGVTLGYDMWMTFNKAGPVQGSYDTTLHQLLVTIAGPLVTLLQGVAALLLVRRSRKLWTYSFLFLAFWMRGVAMGVSLLSAPNDEARVGVLLGLPVWVLPSIFVFFLLALTYLGSRDLQAGWRSNAIAYVMASLVTAAIVFSDRLLFLAN